MSKTKASRSLQPPNSLSRTEPELPQETVLRTDAPVRAQITVNVTVISRLQALRNVVQRKDSSLTTINPVVHAKLAENYYK